MPRRETISLY